MLKSYQLRNYNFKLFLLIMAISSFGVIVINSANNSFTNKQLFGVVVCTVLMIIVSLIDYTT